MNLSLTLVGAGEYTSLEEGASHSYLRFRSPDGRVFDLGASEEQIGAVISFAANREEGEPAQASEAPRAPQHVHEIRAAVPPREEDRGDPNIVEDEENVVQLRSPGGSASPFAGRDDDL